MESAQIVSVFIASPGDVNEEREIVRQVCRDINRTFGKQMGIRLETNDWENDSYPDYGKDAQAHVNEQIAQDMSEYDLFVGIMWNRFGTQNPRAGSGTEEEFRRGAKAFEEAGRPHIMFYFNQAPSNLDSVKATEQKGKVLAFRDEIREKGKPHDYTNTNGFERLFRNHIELWLEHVNPRKLEPPKVEVESESAAHRQQPRETKVERLNDSGRWFLLKTGFFLVEEVNELGDGKISLKVLVTSADEDASFRALQPNGYGRQDPIPFAYQNTGAIVRVLEAKRKSAQNKDNWELLLQLEKTDSGFHSEMTVNGVTPNQIAEMRARFILLNEKPASMTSRNYLDLNQAMVNLFISGFNTRVKAEGSVLPDLWQNLEKEVDTFLPLARLWSVFHLITSETCEHILELTVGPVIDEKIHIKFRGRRRKRYVNEEPYIIEFEGDCDLTSE